MKIYEKLKKFFLLKILKKKYTRVGKCNQCGNCCKSIYVRHGKHLIKDEELFEKLKPQHFFYSYLKIIDKTEDGLIFECTKLDKEKNLCTAYKKRALLCRQYPQEEIFSLGAIISDECGFEFIPIESFQEILSKLKKN